MSVIVTDTGFTQDIWGHNFTALADLPTGDDTPGKLGGPGGLDLASDTDPGDLIDRLHGVEMLRVDFPSSADGRGFTLARRLRMMGYRGRLRARGHVLADQYAMARRSGFDEIEIDDDLAARQSEDQWLARSNWQDHNYQARLRG